jgi:DNA helicase-2/ATP-dependent DNA helicase PcrA
MSNVLTALDEQQRAAASCISGPVVILAGAGTGKTRTITHRLAHAISSGVVDPSHTLTVTFTTRAAGEVRSRLGELGVSGAGVRTFHSAALRQLRYFYPQVFAGSVPTLITSKSMHVAQAAARCHAPSDSDAIRDLASEIEWAKVNIMSPDSYRAHAQTSGRVIGHDLSSDEVARVYETYLKVMDEAGCIDFEDVLLTTTALLQNYPELAATVHKQYRYFTVDEFQDVSPVQFELLRLWIGNRDDVCVVGDPAQTIYSFTGATSNYLTGFERHFPRTQKFELTHSYRSTPEILEVANKVLARDSRDSLRLLATKPSGDEVSISDYSDDEKEARSTVAHIQSLLNQGNNARDIAVLYRSNFQSEPIEEQLSSAGIAYSVRGSSRFFERPEVKTAILHLRASANVANERTLGEFVRDILSGAGWTPKAPEGGQAARETWQSLVTLADLADDFEKSKKAPILAEFIAYLDHRSEYEIEPQGNVVTLASIHSAKGLEWDNVFVLGLSEGLLPINYAQSPKQIDEERRLFFVALSRAKSRLFLSWAKSRRNSVSGNRNQSMFLTELNRD